MTGLEIQIEARRMGKKYLDSREDISYTNISKLIGKTYKTTKKQIQENTLSVDDAIKIFKTLFKAKSKFEAFEYLFTEQGE